MGTYVDVKDACVVRGQRWILRPVSLQLRAGTLTGVVGPNGSGKSTLARLMAGQLWPTLGEVLIHSGRRLQPAAVAKQHVRTVQPSAPLDFDPHLSATQIVLTGFFGTIGLYHAPTAAMRRRGASLLQTLGLGHVAASPYGILSTGEKVRTQIARAMAIRPGLLILDEPTSGLDLLARERVLATIRRLLRTVRDTAILLITHHIEELPPETKQVLLLSDGQTIGQGMPEDVFTAQRLGRAYGVQVEVHRHHDRFYTTVHPSAWKALWRPWHVPQGQMNYRIHLM